MLKWNGQRVAGSVIILISQGSISSHEHDASVRLLQQEDISIATIEYPSIGDGKISVLSQETRSPHYTIRESGVGTISHMSTYIQLVNSMMEIQRFFTRRIAPKWPTLVSFSCPVHMKLPSFFKLVARVANNVRQIKPCSKNTQGETSTTVTNRREKKTFLFAYWALYISFFKLFLYTVWFSVSLFYSFLCSNKVCRLPILCPFIFFLFGRRKSRK